MFIKRVLLKLFLSKSVLFRKEIILIILLFCLFSLNAQEKSHITLRIEPGVLVLSESESLGLILNVEPKIEISESTVIGLRFGVALNSQKLENSNGSLFNIDTESDNGVVSFIPIFDYYLNENKYRPYLGLGIGFYILSDLDVSQTGSGDILEINIKNQVGALFRGGFELSNTRLGLEYNFVPNANIEISRGQIIGTANSSYFGLSIGFTIGGGKS